MTCLEYLFADLDTQIDSEIDSVGCTKTDCPYDKRVNEEKAGEG